MSNRDAYVAKIKLQIDEMNTKVTEIETAATAAAKDVRDRYAVEMGNMRVRARAASAKLEQLQAASEDGWKALVADMERMRKDVTHSFQELKGRL